MSEVTLTVGGREYAIACADGEEAHVKQLGEAIDAKFQQLGGNVSNKEAQNMLFAALLLADEAHDQRGTRDTLNRKLATVEAERDALADEVARLRSEPPPSSTSLFDDPELAPALERFADLLETCADKLESKATNT